MPMAVCGSAVSSQHTQAVAICGMLCSVSLRPSPPSSSGTGHLFPKPPTEEVLLSSTVQSTTPTLSRGPSFLSLGIILLAKAEEGLHGRPQPWTRKLRFQTWSLCCRLCDRERTSETKPLSQLSSSHRAGESHYTVWQAAVTQALATILASSKDVYFTSFPR